jgi:hypothetical protein
MYLFLPAAQGPGVYSSFYRIEYQKERKILKNRAREVRRADNLTAICDPIV